MRNTILALISSTTLAAVGAGAACRANTAPADAAVVYGPPVAFGQGSARTWMRTDATGAPAALGIALTEAALTGLPTTVSGPSPSALMATLPLPAGAAVTGFDHAEIGWNPLGHEPEAVYGLPHFDFHFFTISPEAQRAILPSDPQWAAKASALPAAAFVPTGYAPPPSPVAANAVPQMGVHWVDVKSPELNGQRFTSTFIFGSWDGKFIFLEPMVTKAFLETHPDATWQVPQPARWAQAGTYPTTYTVAYDAATKEFRFTLGGLVKRAP